LRQQTPQPQPSRVLGLGFLFVAAFSLNLDCNEIFKESCALPRVGQGIPLLALLSCLDMRHATSSAFKIINVGQIAKSRRYSNEPHGLSAARAKRGLRRRAFIAHGTKRSFSRDYPDTVTGRACYHVRPNENLAFDDNQLTLSAKRAERRSFDVDQCADCDPVVDVTC